MRPTRTLRGAAVAVVAMALAGCSSSSSSTSAGGNSGKPHAGGDLVVARADEATSLLPSVPQDNASIWIIEEIYDTLVVPSQDGRSVTPSLATSWRESADKLSWTFNLHKDAKFTNGQPLTSADVKFSIEQNQKPDAPFSFIDTIITKMDTPSPNTIVFHTKAPWAPLPADMALYANSIVPKNYAGKSAADFAQNPIGSGPFKFASWSKGSSLKIDRNPQYWRKDLPYLDSVTFTVVPDSNTRSTQLASGQIQINEYPAKSSIKSLQKQPNVTVSTFDSSQVDYLGMNTRRGPLADVNVRRAINQAIDKNAILQAVYYGFGKVASPFLSPTTWAYNSSLQSTPHDVTMAKGLFVSKRGWVGFGRGVIRRRRAGS